MAIRWRNPGACAFVPGDGSSDAKELRELKNKYKYINN
jgi:hypothetical protein